MKDAILKEIANLEKQNAAIREQAGRRLLTEKQAKRVFANSNVIEALRNSIGIFCMTEHHTFSKPKCEPVLTCEEAAEIMRAWAEKCEGVVVSFNISSRVNYPFILDASEELTRYTNPVNHKFGNTIEPCTESELNARLSVLLDDYLYATDADAYEIFNLVAAGTDLIATESSDSQLPNVKHNNEMLFFYDYKNRYKGDSGDFCYRFCINRTTKAKLRAEAERIVAEWQEASGNATIREVSELMHEMGILYGGNIEGCFSDQRHAGYCLCYGEGFEGIQLEIAPLEEVRKEIEAYISAHEADKAKKAQEHADEKAMRKLWEIMNERAACLGRCCSECKFGKTERMCNRISLVSVKGLIAQARREY